MARRSLHTVLLSPTGDVPQLGLLLLWARCSESALVPTLQQSTDQPGQQCLPRRDVSAPSAHQEDSWAILTRGPPDAGRSEITRLTSSGRVPCRRVGTRILVACSLPKVSIIPGGHSQLPVCSSPYSKSASPGNKTSSKWTVSGG